MQIINMKKLINTWKECSILTKIIFAIISPLILSGFLMDKFVDSIMEFQSKYNKNS